MHNHGRLSSYKKNKTDPVVAGGNHLTTLQSTALDILDMWKTSSA